MTKSELRKLYLEKRSTLEQTEVAAASRAIANLFFDVLDLTAVRSLHTFIRIPKFNEIDTSVIYYKLWRDHAGIKTFASRADLTSGEFESVEFGASTELSENAWGIREPVGGNGVDPALMDMVLVPLLCFDRGGNRVGYGKGYYDRFLAECRKDCVKVGLSFFAPIDAIADAEHHDVRLDACLTPLEVVRFEG